MREAKSKFIHQLQEYKKKQILKSTVHEYYKNLSTNKLSNLDESSKLYIYSKLKTSFQLEDYLINLKNFNSRQLLTKFRISDHNLEIELGRYKKVPRNQRICTVCYVLEDEKHFFLYCHVNKILYLKI